MMSAGGEGGVGIFDGWAEALPNTGLVCDQQPAAGGGVDSPSTLKKGRKRKGLWTFRSAVVASFEDGVFRRRRFSLSESRSANAERLETAACTRLVGQLMRRTCAAALADKCVARAGRGTRGCAHRTRQPPCPQYCCELSLANSARRELASLAPSFVAAAGGPGDFAPPAARVARSSGRFRGRPPPKGGLAPFCGEFAFP